MTETGDVKTTFSSRLKEKRIEKGWSQYYLAARAGCTNSNISYLEKHPEQKPKLETVEGIAAALGWPVNEARRLAGYLESDDNLTPLEVEEDFRLALHGYKELSGKGQELVKKQIRRIIAFALECERDAGGSRSASFEDQLAEGDKGEASGMPMKDMDKQSRKKKGKKK